MNSTDSAIRRVGVVGCGLMGSGIAEVCARSGLETLVYEVDGAALERGRSRTTQSLNRALARGKLSAEAHEAAVDALAFTTELDDFADRDLVIEAVPEDEALKVHVFATLDRVVSRPDALFASNTSSIPIMKLGAATSRPGQVMGLHFFNPVPVLDLVELVPSLVTADTAWARMHHFVTENLERHAIVSQDRAGFVVNSLLIPYLLAAIRMFESGFALAQDIDQGMVRGCAHPMGPLALADHIGLDTTLAVAQCLYDEFKEPLYAPPPLLSRMVEAGQLGRKAGKGFYTYPEPAAQ
ncbi:3-hydroxybutyryl-CoA dehydrogenase [Streptomyces sp. BpilaLS-43]|uniref:3-hydroxybutyryl-CoA dehydrogenase n=1 Tax=unclassified Streptomyces TaxID=2593676 RepID=UPI00081BA389|nr:3-hydroxybutyryl-CoA dehydrogenase [Streptomyces sp. BpilaLS-43]SCE06690.1 3-hydroxybutyryl-CoA dehydrogenase [Streptomyces sp. BpilaLS-43]